ncbi:hypothetical protein ACBY01_05175 [Sphingomonas sp. ac-8]|uniref:hypothetical protein n=1 Tax=Sphingomonas sp. ac-8 TaxID=3242977 RepID=UPI003A7FE2BD
MASWHRSRRADLGLRASGLLLWGAAYAAFAQLVALRLPPHGEGALGYGLAALGFVAASAGGVLTMLGSHLFDKGQASARWQHPACATASPILETATPMKDVEPCLLVVGQEVDGSWTVHESAGLLLGRFASYQAAQRFACTERDRRPSTAIASSAGAPPRIAGRLKLRSPGTPATGACGG